MCKPKIKDYVHLWMDITLGYSRENLNREGGLGYTFLTPPPPSPGISHFFTLLLEKISGNKIKLNPWIFHKIVLDSLEIPRPKTKIPGNSTLFFLGYPWKFHFVFNYALSCRPVPTKIL